MAKRIVGGGEIDEFTVHASAGNKKMVIRMGPEAALLTTYADDQSITTITVQRHTLLGLAYEILNTLRD